VWGMFIIGFLGILRIFGDFGNLWEFADFWWFLVVFGVFWWYFSVFWVFLWYFEAFGWYNMDFSNFGDY